MGTEVKITPDEAIKVMSTLHLGYGPRIKASCDLAIKALIEYRENHKDAVPELFPELQTV